MRILVAGATGAIGKPLVRRLRASGHNVFAMVRSTASVAAVVADGAETVVADALDPAAVRAAVERVRPEVIINELTSLPRHYTPSEMKAAAERDGRVRLEGNRNLLLAGLANGVRRFLVQSSGFWYAPGSGLAAETEPFALDASPAIAAGSRRYAELEAQVSGRQDIVGVALRYGFFYGPGTWYTPEGDIGEQVRQQQIPIIGDGGAVYSWVHIEDAAIATASALECAPGAYNIVDSDPIEQRAWLPAFARLSGAPTPPQIAEDRASSEFGADAVYYAMRLRGASNEKAIKHLGFRPRRLEWLTS